jgi:hypothetical protein
LRRRLQAHGLESIVTLSPTMPQDQLRALYERASVFVLPSQVARSRDRDGLPNVILEAMAAGLPVVSTSISGIPEAVRHEQTGVLVPPQDPQALAGALARLLNDPAQAQALGQAGQALARAAFDDRQHLQTLVQEMQVCLHAGHSPAAPGTAVATPPPAVRSEGSTDGWPYRLSPGPKGRVSAFGGTIGRGASGSAAPRCVPVLSVIWSLEIGGAERIVASLMKGLDRSRFAPQVACLHREGALAESLRHEGIPVTALHKRPGLDLHMLWRLSWGTLR